MAYILSFGVTCMFRFIATLYIFNKWDMVPHGTLWHHLYLGIFYDLIVSVTVTSVKCVECAAHA